MKRFKMVKFVDAEQMFQSNAEKVIGKIDNLTHGNDGYLVDDPDDGAYWVPKSVFEKNAIPAHTRPELLNMMIIEASSHIDELKEYTKRGEPTYEVRRKVYLAVRHCEQYVSQLQKILKSMGK